MRLLSSRSASASVRVTVTLTARTALTIARVLGVSGFFAEIACDPFLQVFRFPHVNYGAVHIEHLVYARVVSHLVQGFLMVKAGHW